MRKFMMLSVYVIKKYRTLDIESNCFLFEFNLKITALYFKQTSFLYYTNAEVCDVKCICYLKKFRTLAVESNCFLFVFNLKITTVYLKYNFKKVQL